ncbi:MAG: hypothetical protein KF716_03925 [Anaerolineae bacterium]|nr:hypothetical protein [Anaerolineae bacterium]
MLEHLGSEVPPFADDPVILDKLKRRQRFGIYFVYSLVLFAAMFVYTARFLLYSLLNQGSLGVLIYILFPIFFLPLALVIGGELGFIIYGVERRNALPALIAIPLFFLAMRLPLLSPVPNGAERHFYAHRPEYEQIVIQARAAQLPANTPFNVHIEKEVPLVVMFDPEDGHYVYIVYAKQRSDLDGTDACDRDGDGLRQLDKTWWMCFRDAN